MSLMKCGCKANATTLRNGKKIPCCAIHAGSKEGWDVVDPNVPNLEGRQAVCTCGRIVDSDEKLAFFRYKPDEDFDGFYCGCFGWD
jgi:hypothetical protein